MVKVKICGITNLDDARSAVAAGCDALGFVFYRKSPRYISPDDVSGIIRKLPCKIVKVGVFVDEKAQRIKNIAKLCRLDLVQLHGRESVNFCKKLKGIKIIKAFRVKDRSSLKKINDYNADFYMLDAYSSKEKGGTGEIFDWKIIENFEFLKPVILSGGLTPDNVRDAIERFSPYGVDVSSGVEASPGKKDPFLMKKFVENVRKI